MKTQFISVYGTLRQGERANYMLNKTEFIGTTVEQLPFKMVNLGSFPALIKIDEKSNITVETYRISENDRITPSKLDYYEGYDESGDGLYDKEYIELESGIISTVYYMKDSKGRSHGEEIISGDWKNKHK